MERRSMPDQDRWIVDLSAVRDSDVGGGGGGAFRADRVASAALWNRSSPRGRPPPLHRSRGRLRGCFPRRGSGNDVEEQRRSRRDRARYYQKEHSAWSWPREDTRPFQGESSRFPSSFFPSPFRSVSLSLSPVKLTLRTITIDTGRKIKYPRSRRGVEYVWSARERKVTCYGIEICDCNVKNAREVRKMGEE